MWRLSLVSSGLREEEKRKDVQVVSVNYKFNNDFLFIVNKQVYNTDINYYSVKF